MSTPNECVTKQYEQLYLSFDSRRRGRFSGWKNLKEGIQSSLSLTLFGFGQFLGAVTDTFFIEILLFTHELDETILIRLVPFQLRNGKMLLQLNV